MMIWTGKTSDYLIGPYFFDGPVNAASYLAMLETWLIPQLRDRGLLDDVWLHHDGAPAVAYPGIFFGGGSTNSVEDRGQRGRGFGGGSPLVRGSGGSYNLVQEI